MIIEAYETQPHMLCAVRPTYQPARSSVLGFETEREATSGERAISRAPVVDPHLAQLLALAHRQVDADRRHDALDERRPTRTARTQRPRSDERELPRPYGLGTRVGAAGGDDRGHAEARKPPVQELDEIAVPYRARRAADDRRVDGHARAAHGGDLRPAGCGRVTRLDADDAGVGAEQVVPGVKMPAAGDRRVSHGDDLPDDGLLHEDAGERRHVASAGHVAGRVETVRADEVRVREAELPRAPVHHRDEAGLAPVPDVVGERPGRVVRALDQAGLDEVPDGQLLARAQVMLDSPTSAASGETVTMSVELRSLEREEDGHQLREARDRNLPRRAPGEQNLSGRPSSTMYARASTLGPAAKAEGNEQEDSREEEEGLAGAAS